MNSKVAIATMTWARDENENALLRQSLAILAEQEAEIYITDGGSGEDFLKFLHELPNTQVFDAGTNGVFSQIRHSLRAAANSDADYILYAESDKKLFFDGKLSEFVRQAVAQTDSGIVLAERTAESFATFPEFQHYTETVINNLCAEVTGVERDYTYGPFLFNRRLVSYLESLQTNIGWGWRSYLFAAASRNGDSITGIKGDYLCPPEQRSDNPPERIYRMKQLSQHIDGLTLSAAKFASEDAQSQISD